MPTTVTIVTENTVLGKGDALLAEHGFSLYLEQMLSVIADCQAVLAGGMGLGMQRNLEEVGIRPVLTDLPDIQEAVQAFIDGRLTQRPELAH
jgi:hypothetical protein